MNWFRENRFLGILPISFGTCALGAVWFLFEAKGNWNAVSTQFHQTTMELNRLERLAPYPSPDNLGRMRAHVENYEAALAKLKDELRVRALPLPPMAPNEFQSHLRVAMNGIAEKARVNRVKLPDKFYLGFDNFASALPNEKAAPLLGQELAQIEWLLNTVLEARVDAVISFRRARLPEENATAAAAPSPGGTGRKPAATPMLLERNVVEATFLSTPAVARKVLNQISGAPEQFFIIRLVHIRNEKDKGPLREVPADRALDLPAAASPGPAGSPPTKSPAVAALNFIVGNERIETSATIEIVRFKF
jgi:hypothetical protein